jgi:signal transduction histidine kinase/DNA-binding response OmpR family regulator
MKVREVPNLLNAGPSSSTSTRAAFYTALVGSLVLCAGFFAWTQLRLSGFVLLDDVVMTGTPILAGVLCIQRGQREVGARRFWRLLGASYLSYALGMMYWDYQQLVRHVAVPYPSLGDLGFLGSIPLAGAALNYSPQSPDRLHGRVRTILDGLIIASSVLFTSWAMALGPIFHTSGQPALAKVVGLAYPAGFMAVLAMLLLQSTRAPNGHYRSSGLVAGSLICLTGVNVAYAKTCIEGTYYTGHAIDVLWILAFCMGGLAALRPGSGAPLMLSARAQQLYSAFKLALPYVPVAVGGVVGLGMLLAGRPFGTVMTWTAFLVVTLVLLRQYLALHDVQELSRRLKDSLILVARTAEEEVVERSTELEEISRLQEAESRKVAELTELTRALDQANARIQEADRLKSQFLANMSHELRTPLNSIIGFSDILITRLAREIEPKYAKFLRNINSSGNHLLALINDILDLSKIESGKMELLVEEVQPRQFGETTLSIMRGMAAERQIVLTLDAPDDLPAIEADAGRLKQILYNLLSNAVKFSPDLGTVGLRLRALTATESPLSVDSLELAVSDQGVGIDPSNHEIVFEEFRQVDGSPSRRVGGTGLGLALVKKFVALHGGKIEVRSQLGAGATFVVTIPSRPPLGTRGMYGPAAQTGPLVLVVEDDQAAFDKIAGELQRASFRVRRVRSGDEVLNLARALRPAAITLDVVLPGSDGFQVLGELKRGAETRDIPVLIVSMVDNRELGIALGADGYLVKPPDGAELVRRVRDLVTRPAARLLVIDDDPGLHDLVEATLSPNGFRLEHAVSGPDGVERAASAPPDLILLDLSMPGLDGFSVAAHLKSKPETAHVPILVLTSRELSGTERRTLNGQAGAILRKGETSAAALVSVLQDLLHTRPTPPLPVV